MLRSSYLVLGIEYAPTRTVFVSREFESHMTDDYEAYFFFLSIDLFTLFT